MRLQTHDIPSASAYNQTPSKNKGHGAYPPAGPIAEGAGNGVGQVQPAQGGAMKKTCLVLCGLLVILTLIGGIGYVVFFRESGTSPSSIGFPNSTSDGAEDTVLESGSAETDTSNEEDDEDGDEDESDEVEVLQPVAINAALGFYDEPLYLSVIPVAIAVLPSGNVLAWSAFSPDDFYREDRYVVGGGGEGFTHFSVIDPVANEATGLIVAETGHDMFCPGITMIANGDIVVTGGQNANKASIYHLATDEWVEAEDMHISRGYGSSVMLSDGRVFVLGGSWSGPKDLDKDAEVYDPTTDEWTLLPGIQAAFILTDDPEDAEEGFPYRGDNYGMFHPWSDATVFHAGPSETMHWFSTDGEGSALTAGTRPGGNIANGNSVMYDLGKILVCGGSESFAWEEYPATDVVSHITINQANTQAEVRELEPMQLPRVYANAVVLPDGKVLVTGGASRPLEFSDQYAHFQPEIWDQETETFTLLDATHVYGRTYHSTAALLVDGRVITGGGGLCGSGENGAEVLCKPPGDPNHLDVEIFNPPYLFTDDGELAERPTIELSASTAQNGDSFEVSASEPLMMVSMIRMGTATHSTNTDQRRLELCGPYTEPCGSSSVTVTVHEDPGIALAGNWMIFGVNAAGVPSVASVLLVGL